MISLGLNFKAPRNISRAYPSINEKFNTKEDGIDFTSCILRLGFFLFEI